MHLNCMVILICLCSLDMHTFHNAPNLSCLSICMSDQHYSSLHLSQCEELYNSAYEVLSNDFKANDIIF